MILDVGCGSKPVGNVNVDLILADSDCHWNLNPEQIDNFVKADIRFLPFKNKSFFLVYCSHVLEHIKNYAEALEELKRVSQKYVYVIVPFALSTFIYELVYYNLRFPSRYKWLRKHHVNNWNFKPFKNGKCYYRKLRWIEPIKRKNKIKVLLSRSHIPYETLTVFEVDKN